MITFFAQVHCKNGGVTVAPFIGVKHLCKIGTSCGVMIMVSRADTT